jgi:hypothetical protein
VFNLIFQAFEDQAVKAKATYAAEAKAYAEAHPVRCAKK